MILLIMQTCDDNILLACNIVAVDTGSDNGIWQNKQNKENTIIWEIGSAV